MTHSDNPLLEKVYAARNNAERRDAYNDWSNDYDRDVLSFGIRLPFVAATVFAQHVSKGTSPILDAACGTGMHTEPLALAGYAGFIGVDISTGMLALAAKKKIYTHLKPMALDKLDYQDNHFEAAYCIGALAPGHAPAESLNELARVTKPNGMVIFSTHSVGNETARPFHDKRRLMVSQGCWTLVDQTEPFISMPGGDAQIKHTVYIYKVHQ